jgi:multiple sugar transport system permease protein
LIPAGTIERRPASSSPGDRWRPAPRRAGGYPHRAWGRFTPYLLIVPALVMYAAFIVYPIFRQFEISFFNWHIFPGASNPFVGFGNYAKMFHDPIVRTAAFDSFLYIVITVPVQMAIGMFAAAMLTDRLPGSALWRAAIYIPVVTSWVVVSWVFAYIFSSQGGVMNAVVGFFTGHREAINWTAQTWTGNLVIWLIGIWKGVGWSFLIFLAALDGVPRQQMESARIDGASERKVWRYVVLPAVRPAITFVTVLLVIGAAQVFTQVELVTRGGPYNSTQVLMTYMWQQAFMSFAFGYAAAMASLLAVALFGFSVAEIRILRQQEA